MKNKLSNYKNFGFNIKNLYDMMNERKADTNGEGFEKLKEFVSKKRKFNKGKKLK